MPTSGRGRPESWCSIGSSGARAPAPLRIYVQRLDWLSLCDVFYFTVGGVTDIDQRRIAT